MPTTTVTVNKAGTSLSTTPVTISATSGTTVNVQWALGTSVTSISSITGLANPPFGTPSQSNGVWSVTDYVASDGTYSYTIGATVTEADGRSRDVVVDPQITNDPNTTTP